MDNPNTGTRIRELRVAAKLSREALAVKSGVSGTTVMRAEQGRRVGTGSLVAMLTILDPEVRVADIINH